MKKLLVSTLLVFALFTPIVSKAATIDEMLAQIQQLLALITQLQAQVNTMTGRTTGETSSGSFCHEFTYNLNVGDSGAEVIALKTALKLQGFNSNDSTSYDEATAAAVTGFQQKYASEILAPYGLLYGTGKTGPSTRAKLNAFYTCESDIPLPVAETPAITVTYPQAGYSLDNSGTKGTGNSPIATIRWTSSGLGDHKIGIALFFASGEKNGQVAKYLAQGISNTGSFVWAHDPNLKNGAYALTVYDYSTGIHRGGTGDGQTGPFTIGGTPSLDSDSTVEACNLDIDGNGKKDALTDGLLITRYLNSYRGSQLITGVIGAGATRITSTAIENFIATHDYDADGDDKISSLTDGLIITRYLTGLTGSSLTTGAVGTGARRTEASSILSWLNACAPVTEVTTGLPDLISQTFGLSSGPSPVLTVGQTISFSAEVKNNSTTQSPSMYVDTFSYRYGSSGSWITLNTTSPRGTTAAGGRFLDTSSSLMLTQAGLLEVKHCVDSSGIVSESNETNNCTIVVYSVNPNTLSTLPIITNFAATPSSITVGQSSSLTLSSTGADYCSATNVGWDSGKTSATAIVNPTETTTYTITCSNSAGSVSKSATVSVSVTQTNAALPDLISQAFTLVSGNSSVYTVGQTLSFTAEVKNSSTVNAPSMYVDSFSYRYDTISPWEALNTTSPRGTTAAGGRFLDTSASLALTKSGTLQVRHCVDSSGIVSESSETNNCTVLTYTVSTSGTAAPTCSNADVNGDGSIDAKDVEYVKSKSGLISSNSGFDDKADLNASLTITASDISSIKILLDQCSDAPYIGSISASSAEIGRLITVEGINLRGVTYIMFDKNRPALINTPSENQLTFYVPVTSIGLHKISAQLPNGLLSNEVDLTVLQTVSSEVMGASKYFFTKDLQLGSSGTEVSELQKLLTSLEVYNGDITGYFGDLTKSAVKFLQLKHVIEPTGTVGPKTRTILNQ